jgi:hypothetical protein
MQDIMEKLLVAGVIEIDGRFDWHMLCFEQKVPVHIGKKNYGVLAETRLFIPGWTMWGALVNCYGKIMGGRDEVYEEGKELFETITCFYPAQLKPESDISVMFPQFSDGKLYMCATISEQEFRMEFTDTHTSTAINAHSLSAKNQSLHEIEVILPRAKGSKEELYWIGLLGIKKEVSGIYKDFINKLEDIFIGGDIRYGFGRLRYSNCNSKHITDEVELHKWGVSTNSEIKLNKFPIRNYIKYDNHRKYDIKKGKLELVVHYDFVGHIPRIKEKCLCFLPGSEVNNLDNAELKLKKGIFASI